MMGVWYNIHSPNWNNKNKNKNNSFLLFRQQLAGRP
jgi:hypothetical protein